MRGLGSVVLLVAVGVASAAAASPLRPKPPDPAISGDALEAFLEGARADRRGNLGDAMAGYRESARLTPRAATYYNLAEVELRAQLSAAAIENLKKYVELAPAAADRAAVEKLIAALAAEPPVLAIGGSIFGAEDREADALVLVDSVVVGRSPVVVRPTVGSHLVERITLRTYTHRRVHAERGRQSYVDLSGGGIHSGNVLITGMPHHRSWREGATTLEAGRQFNLAPGRYTFGAGASLCKTFTFEVKAGVELTYVHVRGSMSIEEPKGCFGATEIVVLPLRVTPP